LLGTRGILIHKEQKESETGAVGTTVNLRKLDM
jgi:hypothetical protein